MIIAYEQVKLINVIRDKRNKNTLWYRHYTLSVAVLLKAEFNTTYKCILQTPGQALKIKIKYN